MPSYVALLRGINVGGHKPIAMARLREALTAAGMQDVRTYIASGNVVFRARKASARTIAQQVERVIEETFAHEVTVFVRTFTELERIVDNNPFRDDTTKTDATVHVWLLSAAPAAEKAKELTAMSVPGDELRIIGDTMYQLRSGGFSDSLFARIPIEKRLAVLATARKLSTLESLLKLAIKE
jgi:uncharacterized protein (DUF1697 family)